MKTQSWNSRRGFFLISILVGLAVLGVVLGFAIPYGASFFERQRIVEERDKMKHLAEVVSQGFYSEDSNQNLSFFTGASYVPAGATLTLQTGAFTGATSITLADATWQAKCGRALGLSFTSGQTVTADSGEVSRAVCFNGTSRDRWLIVGPTGETDKQRYMIVSLMVSLDSSNDSGLTMPVNDGSAAFFNEIWDNNWDTYNAQPPAGWSARLSGAQYALWAKESRGRTWANRLVVTRITQKKCVVMFSNTHSTDFGWLDIAGISSAFTSAPNSGASTSPTILEGRKIMLRRGSVAPGTAQVPYYINANYTHWIQ